MPKLQNYFEKNTVYKLSITFEITMNTIDKIVHKIEKRTTYLMSAVIAAFVVVIYFLSEWSANRAFEKGIESSGSFFLTSLIMLTLVISIVNISVTGYMIKTTLKQWLKEKEDTI